MSQLVLLSVALLSFSGAQSETTPSSKLDVNFGGSVEIVQKTVRGTPGFFRVGKTPTGFWWLLDPENKPFVMKGVCAVNRKGRMGGRRAEPSPYTQVVASKYGPEGTPGFVKNTLERLHRWGFNTLGSWSATELYHNDIYYTDITEFNYDVPKLTQYGLNLPDIYNPEWLKAIDEKARVLCTPLKDDKKLIGWFTDNEFGWAQPTEEDIKYQGAPPLNPNYTPRPTLLMRVLTQKGINATTRDAWRWLLARHGGFLANVEEAWGVRLRTEDGLRELVRQETPILSKGYMADQDAYSHRFAKRYFAESAKAIRKHDPNHLVLGVRFGGPPGPVILDECRYPSVDVLSANNYRVNMYERMDIYYRAHKMPVIVGEFSWAMDSFTDRHIEKNLPMDTYMARMLERGPKSLERVFTHPGVVGYNWYRWVNTPGGEPPYTVGLVNQDDTEGAHNLALTKTHAKLERIRIEAGSKR